MHGLSFSSPSFDCYVGSCPRLRLFVCRFLNNQYCGSGGGSGVGSNIQYFGCSGVGSG